MGFEMGMCVTSIKLYGIFNLLQVTNIRKINKMTFTFDLQTDNIAPFVWMEVLNLQGHFSDNGFILVEPIKTVYFHAWDNWCSVDYLQKNLKVQSLMDIYN